MVTFIDSFKVTGALQSKKYFANDFEKVWSSVGSYIKSWDYTITNQKDAAVIALGYSQQIEWISGWTFFGRTKILKKNGLLTNSVFINSKDVDHSFPFWKARYAFRNFQKAIIYHVAGASGKQKLKGEKEVFIPIFFSTILETWYGL